jgi:hypothetical protein
MPCEWKGHMANDPRTILVDVTKGNSFLKLKGFLKHDHFAGKPTESDINFFFNYGIQRFKSK